LYAAGGAVRDLLLGRPLGDVDLVVEGDALGVARRLAPRVGATLREHPRFGTATLDLPGGGRLDLAAARAETYAHAGALPGVRAARIDEDLARRDFSINAMALRLSPPPARWRDPLGGRVDLEKRAVRMLHRDSARDDPTRAFRAVRYAARLGFRIERETAAWIRQALRSGALDRVSGDRLRREIQKLLAEPQRRAALALAARLGIWRALGGGLRFDRRAATRLVRGERVAAKFPAGATWLGWLLVWAADLTPRAAALLASRLNLSRSDARVLRRWPALRRALGRRAGAGAPALSEEERFAAAALSGRGSRGAPGADLTVRGRDLVAAGLSPGPAIGRALAATRSARRAGRIGPDEELDFALAAAHGRPA
jgi:tRNA nucleotidyltransferase (CCA-adding enzyme)